MKKVFFTLITVFVWTITFAQKTEFRVVMNSGLFSFTGKSAEAVSSINYAEAPNSAYTNNPYGSQQGLCYGISGNLKRVSKGNFLFGLDLGYERLRSKIAINLINGYDGISSYQYNADGRTFLNFNFINLQPFAGYRFAIKPVEFDFTGGLDLGYCLQARESGSATATNGVTYETSRDRKTISMDIRPRLQLSADYKRFGVYVGYSFGLANYKSGYIGGTNECYSRLLRFGVTWLCAKKSNKTHLDPMQGR
jgi:hypothetical protein